MSKKLAEPASRIDCVHDQRNPSYSGSIQLRVVQRPTTEIAHDHYRGRSRARRQNKDTKREKIMYHLFRQGFQDRGSGRTGRHLVSVARGGCHIGMALLTALPVSTGRARTLSWSVRVWQWGFLAYFLPASVAQQQQNKEAGQQTI